MSPLRGETAPPRGLTGTPARPADRRRADVLRVFETARNAWLATGGKEGAHLVPLGCAWDGARLVMATKENSRTVRNLREDPRARLAFGSPTDVVLVDGDVELLDAGDVPPESRAALDALPIDPRKVPGRVCLLLTLRRVQAWRGLEEMPDRTLMADGRWRA
ncbi:hypothetical protein GCM10023196_098340 [Actinoallomurus vinaceus]|uniref:Pyridoxamine 5'-phosphate oxidase N-terminal domain-containing protein n=1 Tax=Actinoallomurus vinaceus TaxID=1080074 RepID=A0ABP8US92_9ACTN